MSWSITFIGNPENIAKALQENSNKLDGQSKTEYDAALPHLIGLVKQNFNQNIQPVLKLTASGYGYNNYSQCMVNLESIGGTIV